MRSMAYKIAHGIDNDKYGAGRLLRKLANAALYYRRYRVFARVDLLAESCASFKPPARY